MTPVSAHMHDVTDLYGNVIESGGWERLAKWPIHGRHFVGQIDLLFVLIRMMASAFPDYVNVHTSTTSSSKEIHVNSIKEQESLNVFRA
jgi:hypothetical protein